MKVFFIVPYPTSGASNRFRVEQFFPYLKQEGIGYRLRPFLSEGCFRILYERGFYARKIFYFIIASINRLLDIFRIISYDVIFIHRESYPIGPAVFEWIIYLMGKPIIFDFDDAIYLPNVSDTNTFIGHFKCPSKINYIIKISSRVIAGNNYLRDYALVLNKNVSVIPTCVDTDVYSPLPKSKAEMLTIGWIGSPTTVKFLNPLRRVFERILEKYSNVNIVAVGADFKLNNSERVISKKWSLDKEVDDLQNFDIGIMPMPENEWTKGKCGFKAILYMSVGIPCVSSGVGVNKELISEGENGFLASGPDEWLSVLCRLLDDESLRRKTGQAARKTIVDEFSLRANFKTFVNIIKGAAYEKKK